MSSTRKIKFSVGGIRGVGKRPTMHAALKDKSWGLFKIFKFSTAAAGFAILIAAIVFTTNFAGQDGVTMVFQSLTKAREGVKYADGISVENIPVKGEYLYSGGEEKEVLKLKLTSGGEIFRLKSLKVKVGGIDGWNGLAMKDSDGGEYHGDLEDGYVNFKNLYFKIDGVLNLSFTAEFPEDLHFGHRIHFEIENPSDIELNLYGNETHVKADYPLRGAYFTVVARKRVF